MSRRKNNFVFVPGRPPYSPMGYTPAVTASDAYSLIDVYARAHVYVYKRKSVTMRHCRLAQEQFCFCPSPLPDSRRGLTYFFVSSKVA